MYNMTNVINDSKLLLEELRAPFDAKDIEWRVQSATENNRGVKLLVLPYLTSRSIMKRLDEVFGGFWQSNFDLINVGNKEAFQCRLSIKIGEEWITRSDASEVSDIEAVKGGHSNALKRAAVHWGIGRYLYELDNVWVELKDKGEHYVNGTFKLKGTPTHLKGGFDTPHLPSWAQGPRDSKNGNTSRTASNNAPSTPPTPVSDPTPVKQERTPEENHTNAMKLVEGLLNFFKTPDKYIVPLMEKTSGARIPFQQASTDQLGKLYHALVPVKTYLENCTKYGLDEDRALYYAQITLKVELKDIYSLFLKMTKRSCEQTLALIREDLNIAA